MSKKERSGGGEVDDGTGERAGVEGVTRGRWLVSLRAVLQHR
jgi:hypothetical protein